MARKLLATLLCLSLVVALTACGGEKTTTDETASSSNVAEKTGADETASSPDVAEKNTPDKKPSSTDVAEKNTPDKKPSTPDVAEKTGAEKSKGEKLVIELVAGEKGKYGTPITFNKGTKFEETVIAYHIPAGDYTATNIGDLMSGFCIYSDEIHKTEDGREEPAECVFARLLDAGASRAFTIKEGQYIKIAKPSKFKIEQG